MIKEATNKLINKESLSEIELREVFDEIFSGLATQIEAVCFVSLLEQFDSNVILSALNSANSTIKKPFSIFSEVDFIQNIQINENEKYLDFKLVQDLICAASGLCVLNHGFKNNYNRSFKILSKMGVNIDKEIDYTKCDFEKLNFNYFYLPTDTPYYKYSEEIRKSLPFDNFLDIVLKFLNPFNAKNLYLGVKNKDSVEKFADIALKMGKNNSIIVSADNGFSYVSINGESYVAEAWKNKIFTYVLSPELLGFKEYDISDIECADDSQNAVDILEIIQNKQKGAKYTFCILNSALALYISKKADSIMDGINLAKKLIDDGDVEEKFSQIKKFYS